MAPINQAKFETYFLSDTSPVIGVGWPQKDGMQYQIEMHKNKEGRQIDYIATPILIGKKDFSYTQTITKHSH